MPLTRGLGLALALGPWQSCEILNFNKDDVSLDKTSMSFVIIF